MSATARLLKNLVSEEKDVLALPEENRPLPPPVLTGSGSAGRVALTHTSQPELAPRG